MTRNSLNPVDLLMMVEDDGSADYHETYEGWLNYWTEQSDDGSLWLAVKFLDADTDNIHVAWFEVFPDQFHVDRNPRP